jgi:hypothetical protein
MLSVDADTIQVLSNLRTAYGAWWLMLIVGLSSVIHFSFRFLDMSHHVGNYRPV